MNDIIQLRRRIERGKRLAEKCWKFCGWLLAIWFCTCVVMFIFTGLTYFVSGNLFTHIINYALMAAFDVAMIASTFHGFIWFDERKLKRLSGQI